MSRGAVSELQREQLVLAYREDIEAGSVASFRRAARRAGVCVRTAKKAWLTGLPGLRPIRDMVASEKHGARAALRREELAARLEEATALAREDAIEIRTTQGRSVRLVNATTTGALAALHFVGDGQKQLFHYMRKLVGMMQSEDPADEKAESARRAFGDIALAIRRLVAAARLGQEMEQLVLGEPTSIIAGQIALKPVAPLDASPEALAVEVQATQEALDEIRLLEGKKVDDADDLAN